MAKPKVAFYWCSSCGGCEEAVVDLAEKILDVVAAVDIVFWPVALDFKAEDVRRMNDGEITAAFINGAIRMSEQREMAELLRKKSQFLIAFGACSYAGGIPALANQFSKDSIQSYVYEDSPSVENPERMKPQTLFKDNGNSIDLPEFWDEVRPLNQVVDVDYYLPGCPPTPNVISEAISALLSGSLPQKGAVLSPNKALCSECLLNDTKPEKISVKEFKRPHEFKADPGKCLLTQGLVCLGPVTRCGCSALCVKGNMPCSGCFGPLNGVRDYGAKALSFIASIIDSNDPGEISKIAEGIPDPLGTFYRYNLPVKRRPVLNKGT